ncbi:hypothetical protein Bpfe_009264 [Biomphalaria pfeifferi]|uniref:Uncharacterized protein n=1 Tax=Biomphalaria pfeifferi TaxID=112525 RepID=A0AAD8FF12_BIOPF|nr:hypothetical protein Bpfe_009264 [Biomphalaria pfeifferi]
MLQRRVRLKHPRLGLLESIGLLLVDASENRTRDLISGHLSTSTHLVCIFLFKESYDHSAIVLNLTLLLEMRTSIQLR